MDNRLHCEVVAVALTCLFGYVSVAGAALARFLGFPRRSGWREPVLIGNNQRMGRRKTRVNVARRRHK